MKLEDFLIEEEGDDSRHLPNGNVVATWDKIGKVWNIGPGLTHGVVQSTVWTPEQLKAAEDAEFAATKAAVARLVKVALGENRMTALESLTYNIGVSGFAHSTVLRDVNASNFAAVPAAFRLWNESHGVVVPGLIKRREDEIRLWNHPDDIPPPADLKTSKNVPQAMETTMADANSTPASTSVPAAQTVAVPVATLKAAANVSSTTIKTSFSLGSFGTLLMVSGPFIEAMFPSIGNAVIAAATFVSGAGVLVTGLLHALNIGASAEAVTNGYIDAGVAAAKEIASDLGAVAA